MRWGVIQGRYVVNGAFPTVVCSGLHVVKNVWAVKEVFGRTPEAGKLRWVASQDLKVVIGKVLLVHPAFVAVDGLSVYGQIGAPLQGKSFREAVASAVMDVLGEVLANKD